MRNAIKPLAILTLVAAMVVAFIWCSGSAVSEIVGSIVKIDDPTERGLCWIAAAIALHAIVGRQKD